MTTARVWSPTPDTFDKVLAELCDGPAPVADGVPTAAEIEVRSLDVCRRERGLPPTVVVAQDRFDRSIGLRSEILSARTGTFELRVELKSELKRESSNSPVRFELRSRIEAADLEVIRLNRLQDAYFVPWHGPEQLVSPQQLLMSGLFNVRSKTTPRASELRFESTSVQHGRFTYEGPELRQSDGLVFMALVNMVRDFRVGTLVSFDASEMCNWLYGYYDGAGRARLRQSVHRLQHALLIFDDFSVQLAMRFNFPSRGRWTVTLDPEIVKMFKSSRLVWLDFNLRKLLPDGLSSWLYAYVEAQTKLIPQSVTLLREMCGSDAFENRTFNTTLVRALGILSRVKVIDDGWSISDGVLRWRKLKSTGGLPND